MPIRKMLCRGSCVAVAALLGACSSLQLHVDNIPRQSGGELSFSGTGFTPHGEVRISSGKVPGNGWRRLGPAVLAGDDGSFHGVRYAYQFVRPYEGRGCPDEQSDVGRIVVVTARDLATNSATMDSVVVADCFW